MQEIFFELVRKTKAAGASLFISSHNLNEIQKMCDRVGFIREGKLISEQNIAEFSGHSAVQTYDISFAGHVPLKELRQMREAKITANTPRHATIQNPWGAESAIPNSGEP
jgi:ABC-2 type transport system ATP-binding protein